VILISCACGGVGDDGGAGVGQRPQRQTQRPGDAE
jgi:hypothetical protein